MNELEQKNIKKFVGDFLHDALLYWMGTPLTPDQEIQFNLNFEKKFDQYLTKLR